MKIAFTCRNYIKGGGISRYVVELAERLCCDHEVNIFTHSWDKNLENSKIIIHKVPMIAKPLILAVISFAFFSQRALAKDKFDIIVSPLGDGIKADVFTAHSCHRAWVEIKKKSLLEYLRYIFNPLHKVILLLEKTNLKRKNYEKIISVSQQTKNDLIKYYGVQEEDVAVIYNGVNIKEFSPQKKAEYREDIRKELKIKATEILLLFVANEFKRKGLKTVIEALALLREKNQMKLLVIGKDKIDYYLSLAQKLKISEKIIYLGWKNEINKYFAASDVFVLPTLLEPFGLVAAEAMACGVPVIVSQYAGVSELITDGEDGILLENPQDSAELKMKILSLLDNQALRNSISEKARLKIEKYSWNNIAKEMLPLFQNILETKRR